VAGVKERELHGGQRAVQARLGALKKVAREDKLVNRKNDNDEKMTMTIEKKR
jgi:hypothetical protein